MTTKGTYDIGSNQHEKKGKYKVKGLAKRQIAKSTKPKKPLNPSFDKAEPNYDTVETDEYGKTQYALNGERHRTDGPAVIYSNGDKSWYQYDKLHRIDGPAVEWANYTEWDQCGKAHRTDGPAVEWASGTKAWFQNGVKHRTGGPAVEWASGDREYWENGELIRKEKS